jgi:UPF0716 protein FxsA
MLRPFLPLIVFVAVVLLEIFGFAWVGDAVGALMTVALVVFTAALGLWVFRLQGVAHWQRMQRMLRQGELPAQELLEGWLLMLAAVLLLVPGFFSDALGFGLLVPPLRSAAARWLLARGSLWTSVVQRPARHRGETIEGEYRQSEDHPERLDDRRDP